MDFSKATKEERSKYFTDMAIESLMKANEIEQKRKIKFMNKTNQKHINNLKPIQIEVARIEILRSFEPNVFKDFIQNPAIEFFDNYSETDNEGYYACDLIGYRMETSDEFKIRKKSAIKQVLANEKFKREEAKKRKEQREKTRINGIREIKK